MAFLTGLFRTSDLAPHGFCLSWRPELLWLQIIPDAIIGLSYYSIPLALAYVVSKRDDLVFGWIFWMFAAFILASGTTHLFEIWTLWHPDYAAQGLIKAATAAVSVATTLVLWPLLPRALALPSPKLLRRINDELSTQTHERNAAVEALRLENLERRKTEDALRQSQKMEALGQLTGGVVHDFNNLLLILQGNLHMVRQSAGPEIDGAVAAMERAIARGESLTRQLLTFARRRTLQPRILDLHDELPKLASLLKRSLRGDITVEIAVAPGAWPVEIDPNEFELALINIASNARDAMPKGGTLRIEVDNEILDGARPGLVPGFLGDFVRIAMTDTGNGIPAAIIDRIFEPFFTTKRVGKGTGLGLAQVYGLTRQSGGFVDAWSEEGTGTRITLYLPRAKEALPAHAPRSDLSFGEGDETGETVLIVEDNFEVAEVSAVLLRQFGYRVKLVENAEAALTILSRGEAVDAVFSDIVMPGAMSGLDLARTLRQRFPHIPVLLTTGYSSVAGEASAEGFPIMPKPFRPDALYRAIRNVMPPIRQVSGR